MDESDHELALLIVPQLKGSAKDAVDICDVEDLEGSEGPQIVWQILDQAPGKLAHERLPRRQHSLRWRA